MVSLILLGDDHVSVRSRRAALAESSGAGPAHMLSFDVSVPDQADKLVRTLSQVSLFAEPRLIEARGLETIDAEYATRLADAVAAAPATDTVVLCGTRLPEAAKKPLAGIGVEQHTGAPATAGARVRRLAESHQLTLTDEVVADIVDITGGDLGAAASLLYALTVTGISSPTVEQVRRFAGAAVARGTAWGVADALADGDVRTALAMADALEPLAVLSYLGTRMGQVGRTVETPLRTPAEVAGAFGIPNLANAQRLLEHATRLGPRGVASSWTLLVAADVEVKRSATPRLVLDATLVKLARLWSSTTPEPEHATRPAPRPLPTTA